MRLRSYRLLAQVIFLFLSIIGIFGIGATGLIFPFFFCNASPGAVCVCPIWALEHAFVIMQLDFKTALAMLLYLFGFLGAVGFFVGRSFCGWACPIGFIQDIAKHFKGKINPPLNLLLGIFIIGWLMFGSIFIVPNMATGYIGTVGVAVVALSLYGLLTKLDNLFISSSVLFLIIISMGLIYIYLWDQIGLREIGFYFALVLLSVSVLSISIRYIQSTEYFRNKTKYYHHKKWYLIKYLILILIPITSYIFLDKWFTNIDPIGGLTAGVPVLMYESDKWNVSNLLWLKFILIGLFFWLILFTYRGFCRYICPVGALMAPTNKISLLNIKYYPENCTKCNKCNKSCPMKINVLKMDRDMECIRCGRCIDACKDNALHMVMLNKTIR